MMTLRLEGRTYQYIADEAGVTRQRIQQILSPPPAIRNYVIEKYNGLCGGCGIYVGTSGHVHHSKENGEIDYDDKENLKLLCISCHRKEHVTPPKFQCLYCKKPIRKGIFCDATCFSLYHTTTLTCSFCGETFSLRTSEAYDRTTRSNSGMIFCTNKCQGKWIGKNYGFGVYPEHVPHNCKWDYEKVYKARDETGFGATKLGRLLNIPAPTITDILRKRIR